MEGSGVRSIPEKNCPEIKAVEFHMVEVRLDSKNISHLVIMTSFMTFTSELEN